MNQEDLKKKAEILFKEKGFENHDWGNFLSGFLCGYSTAQQKPKASRIITSLYCLNDYPNVNLNAFKEWMAYKKYKNKGAITKTLNMLNKYDHQTQQEMVDKSIMNEYKGLFEPKQQRTRTDNNVNVAKSWLEENNVHEICKPKELR